MDQGKNNGNLHLRESHSTMTSHENPSLSSHAANVVTPQPCKRRLPQSKDTLHSKETSIHTHSSNNTDNNNSNTDESIDDITDDACSTYRTSLGFGTAMSEADRNMSGRERVSNSQGEDDVDTNEIVPRPPKKRSKKKQAAASPAVQKKRREPTSASKRNPIPNKPDPSGLASPGLVSNLFKQNHTPAIREFGKAAVQGEEKGEESGPDGEEGTGAETKAKSTKLVPYFTFQHNQQPKADQQTRDALSLNGKYFDLSNNNEGYCYGGWGCTLRNVKDAPVIRDFRTAPDEDVKVYTRSLLKAICDRPKNKTCAGANDDSKFSARRHTKCFCWDDHRRAVFAACPQLAERYSNPEIPFQDRFTSDDIPEVLYQYFDKVVRLYLAITHRSYDTSNWEIQDIFDFQQQHMRLSFPQGQNKLFYYMYCPFETHLKSIECCKELQWCASMMSEVCGNAVPVDFDTKAKKFDTTRIPLPEIIRTGDAKNQYEWCVGPYAVYNTLVMGTIPNDMRGHLIADNYNQRDVTGRQYILAPPGYTVGIQRAMHNRFTSVPTAARQDVLACYLWKQEEGGLSENSEPPRFMDVKSLFTSKFGAFQSESQFKSRFEELKGAITSRATTMNAAGNLVSIPEKEQHKAFSIASSMLVYQHPDNVLHNRRYSEKVMWIKQQWVEPQEKDTTRKDKDMNTDKPFDPAVYEEIENGLPGPRKDALMKNKHYRPTLQKLDRFNEFANSNNSKRRKDDSIKRWGLSRPEFATPETTKTEPPESDKWNHNDATMYRRGLKGVLLALHDQPCWNRNGYRLTHDDDCHVIQVPAILRDRLYDIEQGVLRVYGYNALDAIAGRNDTNESESTRGMKRLCANNNLLVSKRCFSFDELVTKFCPDSNQLGIGEAQALTEAFRLLLPDAAKYRDFEVTFYVQMVTVDITKKTMEAMRLELPFEEVEQLVGDTDNCAIRVGCIPCCQPGMVRVLYGGPFNDGMNEEETSKVFTGNVTYVMEGSMLFQPVTLPFSDGLNANGRSSVYICPMLSWSNGNKPDLSARATPRCYLGKDGPLMPPDKHCRYIDKLSLIEKITTNSDNPMQDLCSVVSLTPTRGETYKAQLDLQGGSYIRQHFGPTLIYGHAEDIASEGVQLNRNPNARDEGSIAGVSSPSVGVPADKRYEDGSYAAGGKKSIPKKRGNTKKSGNVMRERQRQIFNNTMKLEDAPTDLQGETALPLWDTEGTF